MPRTAIIIGAGPAGLTAAYELLKRTDILPVILEKSGDIGGISKTVNYKGNRMDIGGHRFFSKSDRVMKWWMNIMPVQHTEEKQFTVTYQRKSRTIRTEEPMPKLSDTEQSDKVMLIRRRLSRIYFLRKFFTYPIQLSLDTLKKLGLARTMGIIFSYGKARLFLRKPEKNLEDFFINRFGDKLYRLFFKDYTEKVWGVSCTKISAEWGAQRIKGISIAKAIAHAVKTLYPSKKKGSGDIGQKDTETSLIEKFLYPKFGPGQLWEEVARQVQEMGGRVLIYQNVKSIHTGKNAITAIEAINSQTGEATILKGDYFFSTMPVQELIAGMNDAAPSNVQEVARGLQYRDFITVGVLLRKMDSVLPDTWIYIQEKDVKVGRLQIFNNWSPFMVKDSDTIWIGMEYFCNEGDAFWSLSDQEIKAAAVKELDKMGLASVHDVLDSTVLRVEKTYPAYFGTYNRFDEIRQFTDSFENLFLVGRNGMHKYNNSDHSMLTAMVSVDNIAAEVLTKSNIWEINTEQEYHEEKSAAKETAPQKEAPKLQPAFNLGLKDYIFRNPANRYFVWTAVIGIIVQFLVFKFLYPFASFINGDSYVYIQTAYLNYDINTYPVGYSKFLRILSVFTKSDTVLVGLQYLSLQTTLLAFLFTLFYFYKPGKWVKIILFGFMLFNPIFLYLANYVSSDALFISLSLLWFTELLWIIHRPTNRLILVQALVLFLAFTVRYNALYYPIIGIIAFFLSRHRIVVKLAGQLLGFALIAGFMFFTSSKYYELAGKKEFSPFTGWQMANNAMYAYKFVDSQRVKKVPARFQQLDKMVRTFFDTTRDTKKYPAEMLEASTVYMWDPHSPLQKYMNNQFKHDSLSGPVKRWATMAPLYADYGSYLIREYPIDFAKYYLWPNALKYYAPPVEFLENYSTGVDTVSSIAQYWFDYKTNKLRTYFKDLKVNVLSFYPILVGIMNVVFILGVIGFLFLQGYKRYPLLTKALVLVVALWLVNFGFSVFASPIALRFQLFPILVFLCFSVLFMEYMVREARTVKVSQ